VLAAALQTGKRVAASTISSAQPYQDIVQRCWIPAYKARPSTRHCAANTDPPRRGWLQAWNAFNVQRWLENQIVQDGLNKFPKDLLL
jgi:hypothetical protein